MGFRLRKVLYELNISLKDAFSFLVSNGLISKNVELTSNFRLNVFQYKALQAYFSSYGKANGVKNELSPNITGQEEHPVSMEVSIDNFIFGKGIVSLKFSDSPYVCCYCMDPRISETLNKHTEEIKEVYDCLSITIDGSRFVFRKNAQLWLLINLSRKYDKAQITIQKDKALAKINRIKYSRSTKVNEQEKNIKETIEDQFCTPTNIDFHDGYYLIWIVDKKGNRITSIRPLRIADKRSSSEYNRWAAYFGSRMAADILISYNKEKVLNIKGYKLSDYIKILANPQTELATEDFLKFLSDTKISLRQCKEHSSEIEKLILKYDSAYLDYLSNKQNKRNILKAYEAISTMEEDCFFFSIDIDNEKEALILENTEPSRASEVFIIYKKDYEVALTTVFNYFTNFEMDKKRELFRRHKFPCEIFHAISYKAIDHNKQQWFSDINRYINAEHIKEGASHLNFVAGLRINKTEEEHRKYEDKVIGVNHVHSLIMKTLYERLVTEYGEDNVGTEINIGGKRIDMVVRTKNGSYDLYEIKTRPTARLCIKEALGQILDYAFFENEDNIRNLYIAGPNETTPKEQKYIQSLSDFSPLPISYICK